MGKNEKSKVKDIYQNDIIYKGNIESYPKFCFKYLQEISFTDSRESRFFIDFLKRLKKLSELGWKEIYKSGKHSYGLEPIPIGELKPDTRDIKIITPEVKELRVFRANGKRNPFLGLMNGDIFHVIFIESKFGDIYDHD